MDWSNEHYVRLYTRDTTTWHRLGWDGQCVMAQMLRKFDMAGVIDIDDLEPWEAVVMHVRAPEDMAKRGVEACLRLGVLEHRGSCLVMPNYIEAQEASKSDKQRQRESRERRRARTARTEPSQNVTEDEVVSQIVTRSTGSEPEASQEVTDGHNRSLSSYTDTSACMHARAREGDFPVTPDDVSREWHDVLNGPDGCPGLVHRAGWEAAYETIAAALNAMPDGIGRHALRPLMLWFWHAPTGPIRRPGCELPPRRATPGHIAKRVNSDIDNAYDWWLAEGRRRFSGERAA